ncbi:MAG: hypothetical protein WKG01_34070 [Kofleriaceae bacterium]
MLRLLAIASVVGTTMLASAAPPPGKVVRVERRRANADEAAPTVCEVKSDPSGFCIGKSPLVGDRGVVVDDTHVIAELKVAKIASLNPSCDMLWSVTFEITSGDLSSVRSSKSIAIVSAKGDHRSARRVPEDRVQSPSSNTNERVIVAVDRDKDAQVDLFVTAYQCDASGNAVAAGSQHAVDNCVDVWSHTEKQPRRNSHTKFASCLSP